MTIRKFQYLIAGAGLAGASAIEGIREVDPNGSIGVVGAEKRLPYHRPPLSKKLWFGKMEVKDVFLHPESFYRENGADLLLGRRLVTLDPGKRIAGDAEGNTYQFEKLLLATGGEPRSLRIPGGDLEGISYYRYLSDYERLQDRVEEGKSVTVIGGGFIGSEMAAALSFRKLHVTMIYPDASLCGRVFPVHLGLALERNYESRGIRILKGQKPVSVEKESGRFVVRSSGGAVVESDLLIVGVGIRPSIELAEKAGVRTGDGIIVDEYLQTSHPDIYAAGDNARFPYQALGQETRLEHWDNALNQGKHAGRNMAGAREAFTYMPYFFSDLFEFGYEAVGEVNSELDTVEEWQKPYDTGTITYMRDGKIRGMMMCNVWDKVDAARELIRQSSEARTPIGI